MMMDHPHNKRGPSMLGRPGDPRWQESQEYIILKRYASHGDGSPSRYARGPSTLGRPGGPRWQFVLKIRFNECAYVIVMDHPRVTRGPSTLGRPGGPRWQYVVKILWFKELASVMVMDHPRVTRGPSTLGRPGDPRWQFVNPNENQSTATTTKKKKKIYRSNHCQKEYFLK
jgi:hypothetical protein